MANSPQAKKRARQAENSRIRNAGQRSNLRTFIK
ncbi:MAG: 30S ribosomal protein S20, partial [Methylomonas sp.]|nr:30S ribosomal protein S20 [Methylomonas sp.]